MGPTLTVQLVAGADRTEVLATVARAGGELQPAFPSDADPALALHHVVTCADRRTLERLQAELLALPSVDGAYAKPPTALP